MKAAGYKRAPKRITLGTTAYTAIHRALTDRLAALRRRRILPFSTNFQATV